MYRRPNPHWQNRRLELFADFKREGADDSTARKKAYDALQLEKAEQAARNREAKAAKLKAAMTCQCCGRAIMADGGMIAHHGYTRPAEGWQTSSCMGARHSPYEVSREQLGVMLAMLRDWEARERALFADLEAERRPVCLSWSEYEKGRPRPLPKSADVTRETWAGVVAAFPKALQGRPGYDFAAAKRSHIGTVEGRVRYVVGEIKEHGPRFTNWKQSHVRIGDAWKKLAAKGS